MAFDVLSDVDYSLESETLSYNVVMTLAFLYQLSMGFSLLRVVVSSMNAHRRRNSSCDATRVSFPVTAR